MQKSRLRNVLYSLPVRLVVQFVVIVVLTAVTIGLPALWVVRGQLDQQAWGQVAKGQNTTQALIAARSRDLNNLALLTAQRPTLLALLVQKSYNELGNYLNTLKSGAGFDALSVCSLDGELLGQSGQELPINVCHLPEGPSYISLAGVSTPWILSNQPIENANQPIGVVVVGLALDRDYLIQLSQQTGLEQILLWNGNVGAASFDDVVATSQSLNMLKPVNDSLQADQDLFSFQHAGRPYFAIKYPVDGQSLEGIAAYDISAQAVAQEQLTRSIVVSIVIVSLIGSLLGILLASRIARPLDRLGQAAIALRMGNLETPITTHSNVNEINQLGYALEDARKALFHGIAELKHERDWGENLLESIVEGIVTLDGRGKITYFSPGAERLSGYKQKQVLGRSCDLVFRLQHEKEKFSEYLPIPGKQRKVTILGHGGLPITLAVTGSRLVPPEAGKASVALVLRDVSEEEAIHRLLGEFLANIAHEFRTPLSALEASIELLLDQLPDLSQSDLEELLNSLHLGTVRLQTLVDNLLEGASIETGRFRVFPRIINFVDVIERVSDLMRPLLKKYEQNLIVKKPAKLSPVFSDPKRTEQVIINLISNAVKFGPVGGEILFDVRENIGEVKVSVADQGPGIPKEHQADIFRRFIHVDTDSDRSEYGAGLGLSVVKAIIEAQGGRVGVENRLEGGAIFWFTLRIAPGGNVASSNENGDQLV